MGKISLMFDTCLLSLAVAEPSNENARNKALFQEILDNDLFNVEISSVTLSEVVGRSMKIKKLSNPNQGWGLNFIGHEKGKKEKTIQRKMLELLIKNEKFKIHLKDSSDVEPQWRVIKEMIRKYHKTEGMNSDKIMQIIFEIFEQCIPELNKLFSISKSDLSAWVKHLTKNHNLKEADAQEWLLKTVKAKEAPIPQTKKEHAYNKSMQIFGFMPNPSLRKLFLAGKERFDMGDYLMLREAKKQKSIVITMNKDLKNQLKSIYLKEFEDVLVLVMGEDFNDINTLKQRCLEQVSVYKKPLVSRAANDTSELVGALQLANFSMKPKQDHVEYISSLVPF